nr:hypothetical protein [Tanacetum cinerariifolium]
NPDVAAVLVKHARHLLGGALGKRRILSCKRHRAGTTTGRNDDLRPAQALRSAGRILREDEVLANFSSWLHSGGAAGVACPRAVVAAPLSSKSSSMSSQPADAGTRLAGCRRLALASGLGVVASRAGILVGRVGCGSAAGIKGRVFARRPSWSVWLTWLLKRLPRRPVVLPWGATEAHNYHLPYATDNFQCDYVAAEAARLSWEAGAKVVVLPTIPFGVNTGQLDITLDINLNPSTQLAILHDIVQVLARQGIPKLVVLNGHGGNDFRQHLRELQAEFPTVFLCTVNWFKAVDRSQ